jgi:hypothetical protein
MTTTFGSNPPNTTSASASSITLGPEVIKPHAPGSASSCATWQNADDETNPLPGSALVSKLNDCFFVASLVDISLKDLLLWNPSLSKDTCKLAAQYSYCVGVLA